MRLTSILMSAPFFLTLSCGIGDGAEDNNNEPEQADWVAGEWDGLFRDIDEESGSSLKETDVKATFELSEGQQGSFKIELPSVDNAYAEGTFRDFKQESLLLKIKKSTISVIGLSGSTTEAKYDLRGNDLSISNDRFELILYKSLEEEPDKTDQNSTKEHALVDKWSCSDSKSQSWTIHIKSTTEFWASISSRGSADTWQKGSVTLLSENQDTQATLAVTDSNVDGYIGTTLGVTLINIDTLQVVYTNDSYSETFSCSKL